MGGDQSSPKRSQRKRKAHQIPYDQKITHGLYKKYLWSPAQISMLIESGKVSPMFYPKEGEDEHSVYCEICYSFYPVVNKTGCCGHQICSECLEAVIEPPPNKRTCPFCKVDNFAIIPYVTKENGGISGDGDDIEYLKFEERRKQGLEDKHIQPEEKPPMMNPSYQANVRECSPKAISIANMFHVNPDTIEELLEAGLTEEDIILQFS
ncbi:hypothetical protein TRFO_04261 [Tritrichomonas foetus]|uniref:RING-type domain-containing protein n=1 Tax=Tritrichomonas foetus TaxID=1144522 RepID=A0A1J4KKN2_9EUKA|nr:hypothetical protein TRFO_04261 [Tritrichomonas foetus]|eukprot:OHT10254.1 hypothetical protein TRFO_04261 [Tritrichomonas foetus]